MIGCYLTLATINSGLLLRIIKGGSVVVIRLEKIPGSGSFGKRQQEHFPMVPLNCNFVFTHVISCGTMRKLHSFPVTWLHGPHLPIACNVHIS